MKIYLFILFVVFVVVSCADNIVTSTGTVFDNNQTGEVLAKFSSIQEKVFNTTCASSGCHGGSVFPNLSGDAYNNIVNVTSSAGIPFINPGNPSQSYLLRKIKGENIFGSRMPEGAPPLSQTVIDSITTWIANGAQRN